MSPWIARDGLQVAALVTAAGRSSRMEGPHKALLAWGEGPLVAHQVRTLASCLGARRAPEGRTRPPIAVVVGARGEEVARAVPPPAHAVPNPRWEEGRSASLAVGFRALEELVGGAPDVVVVVAVDQPLHAAVLDALLDAFDPARHAVAVPSFQGRRGHPVALSGRLWPELLRVEAEPQGLRTIVRRHGAERLVVPVDRPVRWDLNTPEDYARAAAAWAHKP